MSSCCCSLAGTAACRSCSNYPYIATDFPPIVRTDTATTVTDKTFYTYPQEKIKAKWIKADTHNFLWFKNDRVYKCSNCGNFLDFEGVNFGRGDAYYCPNCGAEMREDQE